MIPHTPRYLRQAATIALFMLCCTVAMAIIPPSRTLPEYIKRVYIREFKNNSSWFGAQADLTLYVNDEFMVDGRLDVVQNDRADVRLEGKITSYKETPRGFGGDEFPLISGISFTCVVELWDPYDSDRLVPIARYTVPTQIQYVSDPRRSISETQTEARDRLLRQAAKNIVWAILQGHPNADRAIDTANKTRYNQRRGTGKFDPVITEPRFPKPTPVGGRSPITDSDEVLRAVETVTTTTSHRSR